MLLGQSQLREQLRPTLNGGRRGWNDDEPAVVEATFELVVSRFFGTDYDVRVITEFVMEMRKATSNDPRLDALTTEAMIRSARGDKDVDTKGITPAQKFYIHSVVAGFASLKLPLTETEVNRITIDAEKIAMERGWRPPLAG
jgi:hypothetical protein